MKKLAIILLVLSLTESSCALDPDIFGYFEPQLMGAEFNGEFVTLNSNKLRLDIEAKPVKGVKFGANVNFFTYTGKEYFQLLYYIPNDSVVLAIRTTQEEYTIQYTEKAVLDNAYMGISFKYADLTIGKQQISYGTGYAWNPTDIFNRKDLFDPTYEQPGHSAARLDIPFSPTFSIMTLYSPGESWNEPTGLLRLKLNWGHFDFSFSALTTTWILTVKDELSPGGFYTWQSDLLKEGRDLYGFDLVGQLIGMGIWAEAAYNVMQFEEDFWDGVMGLDYTFRNGLYVLGEIYYNNQAPETSDDYTLTDWLRYFIGETKTLGQSQAYVFAQYPVTDLISAGCSIIGCINDESIALVPQLNYSLFQDVELMAFGNFYLGDEGTMYSKHLGNGGLVRLRVYF